MSIPSGDIHALSGVGEERPPLSVHAFSESQSQY